MHQKNHLCYSMEQVCFLRQNNISLHRYISFFIHSGISRLFLTIGYIYITMNISIQISLIFLPILSRTYPIVRLLDYMTILFLTFRAKTRLSPHSPMIYLPRNSVGFQLHHIIITICFFLFVLYHASGLACYDIAVLVFFSPMFSVISNIPDV